MCHAGRETSANDRLKSGMLTKVDQYVFEDAEGM